MLRRLFIPLLVLLVGIAAAVYFYSGKSHAPRSLREAVPVEHFNLRNGLQVIVMPSDRIPAVTHMLMVRAGGANDPYGKSGLAHYLEHLMFSGTPDHPEGTYERAVTRTGGDQNAHTTRDYTLYYSTVPKEHLAEVMAMESDRLQHINFQTAAARELKVITEERNMRVENNPEALFSEQLDALTFLNHPYHQPVIGWAEDMATFTAQDAAAFFAQHYTPSNMVLLVAGDVDARTVRRLAQEYYGALPDHGAPARNWPQEPPFRLTRHAEMKHPNVQSPRLVRQYVAPSVKSGTTTDVLPLWVMAQYLGGSQTSLLYQTLVVQQKLASRIDVDYSPFYRGPATFSIEATAAPGVSLPQLEAALDQVLDEALRHPPSDEEVKRAKTQVEADMVFTQDGLRPLAEIIAHLAMLDLDENYFYDWHDHAEAVTPTQMLQAAQKVMAPNRRITGYLLPEDAAKPADAPPTKEVQDAQ